MALLSFSATSWAEDSAIEVASLLPPKAVKNSEQLVDEKSPVEKKQIFSELASLPGTTVKITEEGEVVAINSEDAACVYMRSNGLVWEIKSDKDLRNKENTYTWQGKEDESGFFSQEGECTGDIRCDTASYINAVNEKKLCNFSDWRLPTKEELKSLVNYSPNSSVPAINEILFPNTEPSWYWTASTNPNAPDYAWYVLFRNSGAALNDLKERPKHIRLVRGKYGS